MRRYVFLALAGAIAATFAVVPLSAFAATDVESTTNGTNVNSGDGLSGSLNNVNATFTQVGGNGKVTCTSSSLTASDTTDPTAPGTATEANSAQTFGGCTVSGINGATGINSISTDASSSCPWIVKVNDNNETSPATVTISAATASGCTGITATVSVQTFFGAVSCTYAPKGGSIAGSAAEGSSTAGLAISNDEFDKSSGPGVCISAVDFSANYLIKDTSQSNAGVIIN